MSSKTYSIFILCLFFNFANFTRITSTENKSVEPAARKGKFLGLSGYLAVNVYRRKDSVDGFRLAPFWKQWNAVLHVNIQKQKKPHGNVIIIPAGPVLYYPNTGTFSALGGHFPESGHIPPTGLGPGAGHISSIHGINGIHGGPNAVQPVGSFGGSVFRPQFDTPANAVVEAVPPKGTPNDQSRTDLFKSTNGFLAKNATKKSPEANQKTRKRDTKIMNLDKRTQPEETAAAIMEEKEEPADVQEITTPRKASEETTEPAAITTSTSMEMDASSESNAATTEIPTTALVDEATTTELPMTTVAEPDSESSGSDIIDNAIIEIIDANLQPINVFGFYIGGRPNPDADTTYFTTTESTKGVTTIADSSSTAKSDDKPPLIQNSNAEATNRIFKPSIPYEYKNYRYDVDEHFVPIVGLKQVF